MNRSKANLKLVMDYFGISGSRLAKALGIDPSLISRWLTGQRRLKASSAQMDGLTEYILSQSVRTGDIEWLREQFAALGLPEDISTVSHIKQNLVMWLASDGDALRRNLGAPVCAHAAPAPEGTPPAAQTGGGFIEVALALEPLLSAVPVGGRIDVFLSSDEIATMVHADISRLIIGSIEQNSLMIRLVVCVSGNTQAVSRLIDVYMKPLVSGHISLSVVHGLTQTVTNQMIMLLSGRCALLITETPKSKAPPVATAVSEPCFLAETQKSFEQTARYAQPVLNIYGDDFSRNILEILYREFCTPGALDVVKDSINPLCMTRQDYDRFLRKLGRSGGEYAWRSAEFARFKSGMEKTLEDGEVFREILSLKRLNRIAQDGFCRMPGLYFMQKGFVELDAGGCAAVLDGYVRCLETVPNFHVRILDDITLPHADNCWQLKRNQHLAINHWSGREPVMIHSDQLLLLREFQAHFDGLWAGGAGSAGSRGNVTAILQDVRKSLDARWGEMPDNVPRSSGCRDAAGQRGHMTMKATGRLP